MIVGLILGPSIFGETGSGQECPNPVQAIYNIRNPLFGSLQKIESVKGSLEINKPITGIVQKVQVIEGSPQSTKVLVGVLAKIGKIKGEIKCL